MAGVNASSVAEKFATPGGVRMGLPIYLTPVRQDWKCLATPWRVLRRFHRGTQPRLGNGDHLTSGHRRGPLG
jgi:hypothetical protein